MLLPVFVHASEIAGTDQRLWLRFAQLLGVEVINQPEGAVASAQAKNRVD